MENYSTPMGYESSAVILREPGNETRKTNIEADIVACGQFEHNGNWRCCGTASRLHTLAIGYM